MPSAKSSAKAERLLNLVIALLNADRFRDVTWIRSKVEGYRDAPSDESFFRMFERDKGELRDLGIPLQTSPDGAYRIARGEFALPEMSFTAGEKAALALAGRLWETSVLGEAGSGALRKLSDASGDELDASRLSLQPRVRTSDPAFAPIYAAVQRRQAVTFPYRKNQSADLENRRLQPWGLVSWKGRWYVVGHDDGRGDQRTFRLSRVAGPVKPVGRVGAVTVPAGLDLLSIVARSEPPAEDRTAVVQLAVGAAAGLRRRARPAVTADPSTTDPGTTTDPATIDPATADPAGPTITEPATAGPALPGFERLQIPVDHLWDTARSLAALGPDAVVESPPDLRDAVVRLLTDAAGPLRPEPQRQAELS